MQSASSRYTSPAERHLHKGDIYQLVGLSDEHHCVYMPLRWTTGLAVSTLQSWQCCCNRRAPDHPASVTWLYAGDAGECR
jgi:hypothetical protein